MRDKDIEKSVDDLLVRKVDKRRERVKDASDYITHDATVSLRTRKILFDMLSNGIIKRFHGILSSGKEANVYSGLGKDGGEIAIKIYRINAQTSKWMMDYVLGDPRFATFKKKNARSLVFTWATKEFKNLKRAFQAGVPVPEPLFVRENVLVMRFIGKDGTPGRRLSEIRLDQLGDPARAAADVFLGMQAMIGTARLVHGDLSPFNLLHHEGKVYIIDIAQGVLLDHPNARKYFERDVENTWAYFEPALPPDVRKEDVAAAIILGTFTGFG